MIEKFEHDGQRVPITRIYVHPIHGAVVGAVLSFVGLITLATASALGVLWLQLLAAGVFIAGPLLFFAAADATHEYVIQIRGGETRTVTTEWRQF